MYLDTANIEEIRLCQRTGILQGVTTNPTILLREKTDRFRQIEVILASDVKRLFVQIVGETADELFSDYKRLRKFNREGRLAYKVSMDFTGIEALRMIRADDPDAFILGTAVYSADQVVFAALAGCDMVAPYVNRMAENNIDPFEALRNMRQFIDSRNLPCKILAASFKNTNQILTALRSGAHSCTIPAELFLKMINKELAQNAIIVFNRHGRELDEMNS
jgi:TalC/MipB family fructose-6-phosphate aldolase